MKLTLHRLALAVWLGLLCLGAAAQENPAPDDASSREVEKSDEDFRRRMELEDARQRNLGYTLPPETYAQQQEKIDKLPEESRDHIRDQLIEVIVENGEWEPSDALRDYPYEPTAAALADPELLQRENEAWNEQIEKYHRREAAAFGSYHGPVAGPGNPQGADQPGKQGQGPQAGLSGGAGAGGTGSGQAAADGSEGAAGGGTYEPYQANRKSGEERVSTAGVQQSALDFLQGQQGGGSTRTAASTAPEVSDTQPGNAPSPEAESPRTEPPEAEAGEADAENAAAETASERDLDLSTPGLIAIEDLDKLEGAESETDEAD